MRFTPTLAICIVAGVAGGIALARPAPAPAPAQAAAPAVEAVESPGATVTPAGPPALDIAGFAFPTDLVVPAGAVVEITNADAAPHTVVGDDGAFASDVVAAGGTASITAPTAPGTYPYACTIHPSMTGRFVVQG